MQILPSLKSKFIEMKRPFIFTLLFQILIGFSHAQIPILNFTNSTGYAHSADSKGDTVVALFSHVELIDDPNGGVIIDPDSSYYYCLFLYEETVLVKKLNIGDFRDGIFNLNVKIYHNCIKLKIWRKKPNIPMKDISY